MSSANSTSEDATTGAVSVPGPIQQPSEDAQKLLAPKAPKKGYTMQAHLKKIPPLLSVYDALQLSMELRKLLI